jgi:hypothetical protein
MELLPDLTKAIEHKAELRADPTLDALTYLQLVYRAQIEAEGPRMRAAMACLPFETPKLSVVASISDPAAFAERERCIQRSGVRPLTIEHRQIEYQSPQVGDVTGPMPGTDRKMRRL